MTTNKFFKSLLFALTIGINSFGFCIQESSAYPVFAQQNYSNPRAANGKLACANCHLNQKAIEIEAPQAVLPNSVFEVEVKVPYDVSKQQIGANGKKADLNVGGILILPEGFDFCNLSSLVCTKHINITLFTCWVNLSTTTIPTCIEWIR